MKAITFMHAKYLVLISEMYPVLGIADLKSALGKKRRDGKHASLQRLTKMQRVYVSRLIMKHHDDYKVGHQVNSA